MAYNMDIQAAGYLRNIVFEWRGWTSTPYSLYRAGWNIDYHRDMFYAQYKVNLSLPHERRTKAQISSSPYEPMENISSLSYNAAYEEYQKVNFGFTVDEFLISEKYPSSEIHINIDLDSILSNRKIQQPALILPREESVDEMLAKIVAMQEETRIKNIRDSIMRDSSIIRNSDNILLFNGR